MKKVIGFSVWGDNPKYTIGAIKNAKLAKELVGRVDIAIQNAIWLESLRELLDENP